MISNKYISYFYVCLVFTLILSLLSSVSIGHSNIDMSTTAKIISNKIFGANFTPDWTKTAQAIIWEIRLPRAILGILVGAGLAVVGATLQSIMRNNLADPHLFGISSGSALGAVIVILFLGSFAGAYSISIGAFLGALFATVLVLSIANQKYKRISAEKLLLSGVACSFVLIAMTNLFIFMGEHHSSTSILFWMLGGLGFARWEQIIIPSVMLICITPYLILSYRSLNAIMAGEETAFTLGINATQVRIIMFVLCALLTGAMVATSGAIGFVGLMIHHIARFLVGADNRVVLPTCLLLGAIFLLWADILARVLFAPQEIPIGLLTSFFGGVFCISLMRHKNI